MTKNNTPGASHRTPTKHAIMREFVAKERRAANAPSLHWIHRLYWFDLTAANGVPAYDAPWTEACSPGILAWEAAQSGKPVVVDLYEKNPDTYKSLIENLALRLPELGYRRTNEFSWTIGDTIFRACNWDGRNAVINQVEKDDAALVLNDPNAITDWAMHRSFIARLADVCKGVRTLSCLGFNVAGGKRAPFERTATADASDSISARSEWFGLIRSITDCLPQRHDLMLAAFKRDPAQWAYLFSSPLKWRDNGEDERLVANAFKVTGHEYELAWFRRDYDDFTRLCDERILTKPELRERENPTLPFDPSDGEEDAA